MPGDSNHAAESLFSLNKIYKRKIIKSSVIAFVLFFIGGTISNTGWASVIALAALREAVIYLIGFGTVVAAFASLAGCLLTLMNKRFIKSFANIYSVAMIVIAILILFGSFRKY
jgi:hypothetical protein